MPKNYTVLTNLKVTGDLKLDGGLAVDGIEDVTAPTAAGDSYSKARVKSIVDAVTAIIELLGGTTT